MRPSFTASAELAISTSLSAAALGVGVWAVGDPFMFTCLSPSVTLMRRLKVNPQTWTGLDYWLKVCF
jgi:hypothetical protein